MGVEYPYDNSVKYYWSHRGASFQGFTEYIHQISLTGNHSSSPFIIVPVTQGVVPTGLLTADGIHTLSYTFVFPRTTNELAFYFCNNAGAFYLPGSNLTNTVSSATVSPTYLKISGEVFPIVPQYLGHDAQLTEGGGCRDSLHLAFNNLSTITISEARVWGLYINLYAGQPY
jgi:hypothetical protein